MKDTIKTIALWLYAEAANLAALGILYFSCWALLTH
jgi:hypothetical protein